MSVEPRIIQSGGFAVLGGVQMVVKAALEAGVDAIAASLLDGPREYTELLQEHAALLAEKGVDTVIQPDARQAVAALCGGWLSGRSVMGLVSASGIIDAGGVLLSHRDTGRSRPGAALLVFGPSDTAGGQDAAALLRRAGWVVLEPSLQDEAKAFAVAGLAMSAASGRPVALALASDVFEGAASVACEPNRYSGETRNASRPSENVEPLAALLAEARSAGVNRIVNPPGKDESLPLVIVALGRSFGWARQSMAELGLVGRVPILRLGMFTPVDEDLLRRHTRGCLSVLVLDPTGIRSHAPLTGMINAWRESEQAEQVVAVELAPDGGPSAVIQALRPLLEEHTTLPREIIGAGLDRIDALAAGTRHAAAQAAGAVPNDPALPRRGESPPPGSSLIDLSVVLGQVRRDFADTQYMLEQHSCGPIGLAVYGERDDAATLLLERSGALAGGLSWDGRLAGAAAAGAAQDPSVRAVVLMTSRRFFSLGLSAIADAARAGRRAVFVIHTADPAEALGPRRRWQRRPKVNALDMQGMIQAIAVRRAGPRMAATTIDPSDRPRLRRLLERLLLAEGVQVVIARRRRGPRYYRKAREVHQKQSARRGYVAKQGCLVHCPEAGDLSPRRRIELGVLGVEPRRHDPGAWTVSVSWSWADETVMRALAEPAVGLAVLERNEPERSRVVPQDLLDLPDPPRPLHASQDAWRCTLAGVTGTAYDLTLRLLLESGAAMGYQVRCTGGAEPPDEPTPRRADLLFTRREVANAPHVPAAPGRSGSPMLTASPLTGGADLLIGMELAESVRGLHAPNSPVSAPHTAVLIDTAIVPSLASLASGQPADPQPLIDAIGPDSAVLPIARLAEWLWGHQRYAAWVYLGYLVQKGLAPLTLSAIDSAGQRVLGVKDPRSDEAVSVGRKLAIDPGYAERSMADPALGAEELLKTLAEDLAEHMGAKHGPSIAAQYQALVAPLLGDTAALDERTRRQIVVNAQRCVLWGGGKHGPGYCTRFVNALRHVLAVDSDEHGYELTRLTVDGLGRAMLIPDEVYLAALLTAPSRYRRDRRRLNISIERGDKISYIHLLRPEFDLFKRRVSFTVLVGERVLKTLAGLSVLRRVRPGWYRAQRGFRDMYLDALTELPTPGSEADYRRACDIAACTAGLIGRGETRRQSVNTSRRRLEKLLIGTGG